jgi:hypothetical protein
MERRACKICKKMVTLLTSDDATQFLPRNLPFFQTAFKAEVVRCGASELQLQVGTEGTCSYKVTCILRGRSGINVAFVISVKLVMSAQCTGYILTVPGPLMDMGQAWPLGVEEFC